MNQATVNIYFDKRGNPIGVYTIKWVVTQSRTPRLFSTGLKISQESVNFLKEYRNGISSKFKDPHKIHLWNMIYGDTYTDPDTGKEEVGYLKRGEIVIKLLGFDFTFDAFKQHIKNPNLLVQNAVQKKHDAKASNRDVLSLLLSKEKLFRENDQIGHANLFLSTVSSLKRCTESINHTSTLTLDKVTVDFLNRYENWMRLRGKKSQTPSKPDKPASFTTIGIYLRNLRSIMLEALESGTISKDQYPFGKGKYKIPTGEGTNRSIEKEEVEKIFEVDLNKSDKYIYYKQRSIDFWLLSYMCNGANITDLLTLKRENISNDTLKFVRQKTVRTTKTQLKEIVVIQNDYIRQIIARWADKQHTEPHDFVFPFLTHDMTATRKKVVINQFNKVINENMNRLAKSIGIQGKLNTYEARHTFANILQESGVPINAIKEMFGHTNILTTERYFSRSKQNLQKQYSSILLPKSITPPQAPAEDQEIG